MKLNYQHLTKSLKSGLKSLSSGKKGGSSLMTLLSTSKSVLQSLYGKSPVANSTKVIPNDHTSALTS